ncbi:unnamed protein product [Urochloa humidicola]
MRDKEEMLKEQAELEAKFERALGSVGILGLLLPLLLESNSKLFQVLGFFVLKVLLRWRNLVQAGCGCQTLLLEHAGCGAQVGCGIKLCCLSKLVVVMLNQN